MQDVDRVTQQDEHCIKGGLWYISEYIKDYWGDDRLIRRLTRLLVISFTMVFDLELITRAERAIGYVFTNKLLCAEALQMEAPIVDFFIDNRVQRVENNERLALYGPIATAHLMCDSWYEDGIADLKAWTTMRGEFLDKRRLTEKGRQIGLANCIARAPSTVPTDRMVATTLAALLGAVYRDGGDEALERVLGNLGVELWRGPSNAGSDVSDDSNNSNDSFEQL
ncbi:hypothetical protein BU24DRAFT_417016 [Aaosphaeria arxii CBS 175.79]|uniref:RNase III domain-containing protein n=1 Tax=Aaosphaeria arxii CBS 175.79 TaxID=1450172 RepID=A0A6A5Y7Y8_9PLEO|nr:uncharacterized protein BU24DRAFT_417016 [Aaosphaeria arxii CBS 175.79]KAF2021353.1 hypothetical protein BU24DRAFT_417016 [Aaosphaeria arxii CBS 175.79]